MQWNQQQQQYPQLQSFNSQNQMMHSTPQMQYQQQLQVRARLMNWLNVANAQEEIDLAEVIHSVHLLLMSYLF